MKHGMLDGEQCDKMSMLGKHLALRLIKNTECCSMVCDFDIMLTPSLYWYSGRRVVV